MKELLNSIILLVSAVVMGIIVLPLGFVYYILWSVWTSKKSNIFSIFTKIWRIFNELMLVFASIIRQVAIGIDQVGNVIAGELIEDCITKEENTTFSKSGITISASTGKLETEGKLNKVGIWFTETLSKVFEENHSVIAYKLWLRDQEPID